MLPQEPAIATPPTEARADASVCTTPLTLAIPLFPAGLDRDYESFVFVGGKLSDRLSYRTGRNV